MLAISMPTTVYGGATVGGTVAGFTDAVLPEVSYGGLAYECFTQPECVKFASKKRGVKVVTASSLPDPTTEQPGPEAEPSFTRT